MPEDIYAIVASAARYWFLFLGVLIVWRSYSWLRKDRRAQRKRVKRLPDAGHVGELVVLAGSDQLPVGTVLPLAREGTIGKLRSCDVVVPVEGVLNKHAVFSFKNGKGMMVEPFFNAEVRVNGEEADKRGKPLMMYHGSRIVIGEAVLRMRLFVGVDAPAPMAEREFEETASGDDGVYHQHAQLWQTERFHPVTDNDSNSYENLYDEQDPNGTDPGYANEYDDDEYDRDDADEDFNEYADDVHDYTDRYEGEFTDQNTQTQAYDPRDVRGRRRRRG